jgi:hypothetical protein
MLGTVTKAHEQCLRDQAITADQPGPVLRDFEMLLEFLGIEGIEATGKYNLIAIKHIAELDERLTRPLHLNLKRPQIRSHPYLQGLNLLLRASGLSRVERRGVKVRLVLDDEMMVQWDALNVTERYFNLLEAWLRLGRAEMVGEQHRRTRFLFKCVETWRYLRATGQRFDNRKPGQVYVMGVGRTFYLLALMDLFGLKAVELPSSTEGTWLPAGVSHTPFGDAFFNVVTSHVEVFMGWDEFADEHKERDNDAEDEEGGAPDTRRIGAWQPLFQPYFPEWQNNLTFDTPELRGGTYVFRVSLGDACRLLAVPADGTVDDLVSWILESVEFDDEHLYQITYRDQFGAEAALESSEVDEGPCADEVLIGRLPLEPGQSMQLRYDFGAGWRFTITLERIEPTSAEIETPCLLASHGEAPEQYPDWDE